MDAPRGRWEGTSGSSCQSRRDDRRRGLAGRPEAQLRLTRADERADIPGAHSRLPPPAPDRDVSSRVCLLAGLSVAFGEFLVDLVRVTPVQRTAARADALRVLA